MSLKNSKKYCFNLIVRYKCLTTYSLLFYKLNFYELLTVNNHILTLTFNTYYSKK